MRKYQTGLKQSVKAINFFFDYVLGLYCISNKINLKNPKNKPYDGDLNFMNCFYSFASESNLSCMKIYAKAMTVVI